MRLWMLAVLAVVCIVAGMMIYVPPLEVDETFVGSEPTARPLDNVTMADRALNITVVTPLDDIAPEAEEESGLTQNAELKFDATLTAGIVDRYTGEGWKPILIDFASGRWNEASASAPIDRPDAPGGIGGVASTLRIEQGTLVIGEEDEAFLRLYDDQGVLAIEFTAEGLSVGAQLMPMTNADCAYMMRITSTILIDASSGDLTPVAASGRPVWLDRAANELVLARDGDYVRRSMSSGEEGVYRLIY